MADVYLAVTQSAGFEKLVVIKQLRDSLAEDPTFVAMFMDEAPSSESLTTSPSVKLALAVAVVGILVVGIVPSPLLHAARDAAAVFGAQ